MGWLKYYKKLSKETNIGFGIMALGCVVYAFIDYYALLGIPMLLLYYINLIYILYQRYWKPRNK